MAMTTSNSTSVNALARQLDLGISMLKSIQQTPYREDFPIK
jgi:hypothetical protein